MPSKVKRYCTLVVVLYQKSPTLGLAGAVPLDVDLIPPPNMLPDVLIIPEETMLPPVTFPVVLINPLDVTLVNVPTEVMFGCAAVVTVPAVVAAPTVNDEAVPVSPVPAPVKLDAVTVLVADIKPAVNKLPPVTLPLTLNKPATYSPVGANTTTLPTPLTDIVTLAAAAEILTLLLPLVTFDTLVIMPVNCEPLPSIKLPVILPVALIIPAVRILPCIALPVLDIKPAVKMLPPVTLPVAVTRPAVVIFPPTTLAAEVIVLVAEINPAVNKLPPVIFAAEVIVLVALINPAVSTLPPVTLPVAVTRPAVVILPPIILAALVIVLVAEINPAVNKFPPIILAALVIVLVAEINPAVKILPPVTLPVLDIKPAVKMLPPVTLPVAVTSPAVEILPPITFAAEVIVPVELINPAVNKLPPATLPDTVNKLPTVLKVNPAVAAKLPLLLNCICVLAPAAVTLPLILPANVPTKKPAVVILPVALT